MKHVHRFFIDQKLATGQPVFLGGDDAFHAARVLRMKNGDTVELAGLNGSIFGASIASISAVGRAFEIELIPEGQIVSGSKQTGLASLTIAQAIPSGRKMDLIVEKLSELGVDRLVPLFTEKSTVRSRRNPADPRRQNEKLSRWQRVAKSAAAQAKRNAVMTVEEPVKLDAWLGSFRGKALVLATEREGKPFSEAMAEALSEPQEDGAEPLLTLIIGPESGFSQAEIDMIAGRGLIFSTLGPLVLRTETAALTAAALALHRLGALG